MTSKRYGAIDLTAKMAREIKSASQNSIPEFNQNQVAAGRPTTSNAKEEKKNTPGQPLIRWLCSWLTRFQLVIPACLDLGGTLLMLPLLFPGNLLLNTGINSEGAISSSNTCLPDPALADCFLFPNSSVGVVFVDLLLCSGSSVLLTRLGSSVCLLSLISSVRLSSLTSSIWFTINTSMGGMKFLACVSLTVSTNCARL